MSENYIKIERREFAAEFCDGCIYQPMCTVRNSVLDHMLAMNLPPRYKRQNGDVMGIPRIMLTTGIIKCNARKEVDTGQKNNTRRRETMKLNLTDDEVLEAIIKQYSELLNKMGILNPEMTHGTAGFFIKDKEAATDDK